MKNIGINKRYRHLRELLITDGLKYVIKKVEEDGPDDKYLDALRVISSLPDPYRVSYKEIKYIADQCIYGKLEITFPIGEIGAIAEEIASADEEPTSHDVSSDEELNDYQSGQLLYENNLMLHALTGQMRALSKSSNFNLRGRCPFCDGPLVEVIEDNNMNKKELRLRCFNQNKKKCRNNDWVLQDVDSKNP